MKEMKQTSAKWYEEFMKTHKTRILDPDGWDRQNFTYSFHEELVTEAEFTIRLMWSTCSGIVEDWVKDNTPGKSEIQ